MNRSFRFRNPLRINAAALYQEGLAAFEVGRYADAIEKLSAIQDERSLPGTLGRFYLGQAHFQFGLTELRAGRYPTATHHLLEARRINPDSAELTRYLTAAFIGQKRFDLVVGELEKQGVQTSTDATLPVRLAYALMRDGKQDQSVETLRRAVEEHPYRAEYRFHLGLILAAMEEYEEAVNTLSAAARMAPLDPVIRQHLGLALGALSRASEAIEHLTVAQRLAPRDAHAALLLTLAHQAASPKAKERAVEIAGAPKPASEDERALSALTDILVREPDFVEAFLRLPETHVDAEVFAMLAATIERSLEKRPDFADLHYHCSAVYARLGRTDDAIAASRRAVEINPRFVQALIQLGRLYAESQRGPEAIDRLQEAIAHGGNYPDVHFLLGELYRDGGNVAQAREAYKRALSLNENYASAREALATLAAA